MTFDFERDRVVSGKCNVELKLENSESVKNKP